MKMIKNNSGTKKVINPYKKGGPSIKHAAPTKKVMKGPIIVNPYKKLVVAPSITKKPIIIVNPYKKVAPINKKKKPVAIPLTSSLKKKTTTIDKANAGESKRVSFKMPFSKLRGVANDASNCRYLTCLAKMCMILPKKCSKRGLHESARYLRSVIKCFIFQRMSLNSLIDALFQLLRASTKSGDEIAYVTRLLSCSQTMIKFDTYSGNRASFDIIFGSESAEGSLERVLRNLGLTTQDIGVAPLRILKQEAQHHIVVIQQDVEHICRSINAENNGVNYSMVVPQGKSNKYYIFPRNSNYLTASDYHSYQTKNGGSLPVTTAKWLRFIKTHIVAPFEDDREAKSELIDEGGILYDDFSINRLKAK